MEYSIEKSAIDVMVERYSSNGACTPANSPATQIPYNPAFSYSNFTYYDGNNFQVYAPRAPYPSLPLTVPNIFCYERQCANLLHSHRYSLMTSFNLNANIPAVDLSVPSSSDNKLGSLPIPLNLSSSNINSVPHFSFKQSEKTTEYSNEDNSIPQGKIVKRTKRKRKLPPKSNKIINKTMPKEKICRVISENIPSEQNVRKNPSTSLKSKFRKKSPKQSHGDNKLIDKSSEDNSISSPRNEINVSKVPLLSSKSICTESSNESSLNETLNYFCTNENSEELDTQTEIERYILKLSDEKVLNEDPLSSSYVHNIITSSTPKLHITCDNELQDERLKNTDANNDESAQYKENIELPEEIATNDEHGNVKSPTNVESTKKRKKGFSSRSNLSCKVCGYKTDLPENFEKHLNTQLHSCGIFLELNRKHVLQVVALQQASSHPIFQNPLESVRIGEDLRQELMTFSPLRSFEEQPCVLSYSTDTEYSSTSSDSPVLENKNLLSEDGSSCHWKLYQCIVCEAFSSNSLAGMQSHFEIDRSKCNNSKIKMLCGPNLCQLCGYSSDLADRINTHCKGKNHLKRCSYVNHILEGGPRNEWKLNYMQERNFNQIRCNACSLIFYSIKDLRLHEKKLEHQIRQEEFLKFEQFEYRINIDGSYTCKMCNESAITELHFLQHMKSEKHVRRSLRTPKENEMDFAENLSSGNLVHLHNETVTNNIKADLDEGSPRNDNSRNNGIEENKKEDTSNSNSECLLFKQILVGRSKDNNKRVFTCPFCCFKDEKERRVRLHVLQHSKFLSTLGCPLCVIGFKKFDDLEHHILEFHQVDQNSFKQIAKLVKDMREANHTSDSGDESFIIVDDDDETPLETMHLSLSPMNPENSSENNEEHIIPFIDLY